MDGAFTVKLTVAPGRLRAMLEPVAAERGREQHEAAGMPRRRTAAAVTPSTRAPSTTRRPPAAAARSRAATRRSPPHESAGAAGSAANPLLFPCQGHAAGCGNLPRIVMGSDGAARLRRNCLVCSTGCWAPLSIRPETMEISVCRRATPPDDRPVGRISVVQAQPLHGGAAFAECAARQIESK